MPRKLSKPKTSPLAEGTPARAPRAAPRRVSARPALAGVAKPRSKAQSQATQTQALLPLAAGAEDLSVAVPAPESATEGVAKPAAPRGRKTAKLMPAGALPPARIPPEALASPRNSRLLGTALAISLAVHIVALALHFSPFDFHRFTDNAPPLEVALVNAKTAARPTKADVLAQANLDGGGNTDQNRRAKSPLPVLQKDSAQNDIAIAQQKQRALEQKTQELLTQLKSQPVAAPQPKPTLADTTDSPTANEIMERTLETMRLEAQIAKEMDAYQKRPKRRFVGARATEYRFARYVEDWRLKVERVGNLNYPEVARQNKLYGSLLLTVSIRSDGSVEKVEINRSSGSRLLDAAAKKIVEMAAPYSTFPSDIKRDTDILHITRTWMFTKGDELRSQ